MPSKWTKEVPYDQVLKLVIVGDAGVGKSSLVHKFTDADGLGQAAVPTIGVDFKIRTVTVDGRVAKLHLWDTTGNERFRNITTAYYRAAHGIVVAFDVTNAKSFERVTSWLEAVSQFASGAVRVMLIGTKTDLVEQRQVTYERAARFASTHNLSYAETSSWSRDENVTAAFEGMTREVMQQQAEIASRRRHTLRAGGVHLRSAITDNAMSMAASDGSCCACLPFLAAMLNHSSPPTTCWSPVSSGVEVQVGSLTDGQRV